MRVIILGAGGVGGYLGARLITGGADVTFLTRDARAATLAANGLVVKSPLGDFAAPVKVIPAGTVPPYTARCRDARVQGAGAGRGARGRDAVARAADAAAAAAQRRAPHRLAGGALPADASAGRHRSRRRRSPPRRRDRAPFIFHDRDYRSGGDGKRSRRGRDRRPHEGGRRRRLRHPRDPPGHVEQVRVPGSVRRHHLPDAGQHRHHPADGPRPRAHPASAGGNAGRRRRPKALRRPRP